MLELTFPLTGDVLVLNPPGHHRYAFDCVQVRDHRLLCAPRWRWLLGRADRNDWVGWGSTVRAPADAEVVATRDGERDRDRFSVAPDLWDAFVRQPHLEHDDPLALVGNHIVLRTGTIDILLAHLKRGSVRVTPGDHVHVGDPLAEVGASGNAAAPHLHLEAREGGIPDGAPVAFAIAGLGRPLGRLERLHIER